MLGHRIQAFFEPWYLCLRVPYRILAVLEVLLIHALQGLDHFPFKTNVPFVGLWNGSCQSVGADQYQIFEVVHLAN